MATETPLTCTYSETWRGRGIPVDRLDGFVERAKEAGAPTASRVHVDDAPADIMHGLPLGGTRASVTWAYREPDHDTEEEAVDG